MQAYQVIPNESYVGRVHEKQQLQHVVDVAKTRASTLVMYGRRRVGKTELLEQFFANRFLIKLEGVENRSKSEQIQGVMYQLAKYLEDPHVAKIKFSQWIEVFDFIADRFQLDKWTLYFEELQWLANYQTEFISDLKYVWDNRFRHNKNLIIILCGSSPSFMVNKVLHSKALYNRSLNEIHLEELTLKEVEEFLHNRSRREVMTAYLTLGGIPEYLLTIQNSESILIGLAENTFVKNAYFLNEHERIFVSSMADNPNYRKVIELLSKNRFATREQIQKHLKLSSGGSLTSLLNDLMLCGFIEKYHPYHVGNESYLSRYCIKDAYLMFYYKFIHPIRTKIESGVFRDHPLQALKANAFEKWMGFAFERFIRRNSHLIAKILGFSGIDYRVGVFFNRATEEQQTGYQIDLIFERSDSVYTICEIKYYSNKVNTAVIAELEAKVQLFPAKPNHRIQRVLITTEGATPTLIERHYFDAIITLNDIFDDKYW